MPVALHTTVHLHNVPEDRLADYHDWFDGAHRASLASLRGLLGADRFEVTEAQINPAQQQPWRFRNVSECILPASAVDVPALGPLIADARDAGLVAPDGS